MCMDVGFRDKERCEGARRNESLASGNETRLVDQLEPLPASEDAAAASLAGGGAEADAREGGAVGAGATGREGRKERERSAEKRRFEKGGRGPWTHVEAHPPKTERRKERKEGQY